jgi:hypothetical protein
LPQAAAAATVAAIAVAAAAAAVGAGPTFDRPPAHVAGDSECCSGATDLVPKSWRRAFPLRQTEKAGEGSGRNCCSGLVWKTAAAMIDTSNWSSLVRCSTDAMRIFRRSLVFRALARFRARP